MSPCIRVFSKLLEYFVPAPCTLGKDLALQLSNKCILLTLHHDTWCYGLTLQQLLKEDNNSSNLIKSPEVAEPDLNIGFGVESISISPGSSVENSDLSYNQLYCSSTKLIMNR